MYYLVFRPRRTKVNRGTGDNKQTRVRYDYRQQSFIGFNTDLNEAFRLTHENNEDNYQIYELEHPTLEFKFTDHTRYGFRKHFGTLVAYKRTPEGEETLLPNPCLSDEENERILNDVNQKRLEGLRIKREKLAQQQQQLQQMESEISSPQFVQPEQPVVQPEQPVQSVQSVQPSEE